MDDGCSMNNVHGIVSMVLHGTTVQSIVCHGIVRTTVVHGPEFH